MPYRWTISPVAERTIDMGDGTTELVVCPKEHTYIDPARGKRYERMSVIAGEAWALSVLRGQDFSPLDGDAEIVNLFEGEIADAAAFLDQTPQQLGWPAARLNRIRTRMQNRGVDTTGLTATTPLRIWLERIGRRLDANFDPRRHGLGGG